jgi:hypothetical protein
MSCSSSSSTPASSSGGSGSSSSSSGTAAQTSCGTLATPAVATAVGSDGSTPSPTPTGGTVTDGTYVLAQLKGIAAPPPTAEAKAIRFTAGKYEVAKAIPSANVTYSESGTVAFNGTQLTLTATCACTAIGGGSGDCSTTNAPVTTWGYTASATGFDAIHPDKSTGITIDETFKKQ